MLKIFEKWLQKWRGRGRGMRPQQVSVSTNGNGTWCESKKGKAIYGEKENKCYCTKLAHSILHTTHFSQFY